MRDLASLVKQVVSIGPASLAADNTPVAVDRQGYDSLTYEIGVGVGGITFDATNKIEFKLTASDDGTTYTAVTDADVLMPAGQTVGAGGIVRSLTAAHAAASIVKIGYIGNKRYTKMLADFSGVHGTATPICVTALLGHPARAPIAA